MKLCFPESALAQHLVMLGKTGAGKSSALRHIAENRLEQKKRVCIVDPKGDWWGLKSSADGKSPGYPVIAFGDFKEPKATDVPINAHSGKHVAELVATGNRPCIIGFRGWMPAAMTQFWIDFASTLFNANAGELYLFIDEVHNFAPKGRVMDPAAGKSLHWANRIMSEGRGIGLVCAIASQRPQKVHNDTLTCCETLVAMRVTHAADRQALKDWIDGCGDDTGNDLLKNVASLERGEGYVWSPEINFGPQRVKFPMFTTFDSFAPPQLQRKITDSGWADVDLGAVKEKLAAVIQEAKANDPAELKKEIAGLKKSNSDLVGQMQTINTIVDAVMGVGGTGQHFATPVRGVEAVAAALRIERKRLSKFTIPAIGREDLLEIRSSTAALIEKVGKYTDSVNHFAGRVEVAIRDKAPEEPRNHDTLTSFSYPRVGLKPHEVAAMASVEYPPRIGGGQGSPEVGNGGLRRILIAIAQRPGIDHRQLGLRACLSSRSGTFSTYLAKARTNGWVDEGNGFRITDAGIAALGAYEPLPTGQALRDYWLNDLGRESGAARMLMALCDCFPNTLTNDELGTKANISSRSGTFSTYLSKLRGLELIEGRGDLRASAELFD